MTLFQLNFDRMADTSSENRAKIIALWEHAGKSTREIANDLGLVQSTVARIIKRYRCSGSFESDRDKCHRPRKTGVRGDRTLVRLSIKKPHASSLDIAKELRESYDIDIHSSTVRRRLLENNRPAYRPIKSQFLTEQMKIRRLQWCKEHETWSSEDWGRVIFSDESSFEIQPPSSQFIRRFRGEQPTRDLFQPGFRHPKKVMLWSCMSVNGPGRVHVVEGSMNSVQYKEVISHSVIPQIDEWFGTEPYWFQQDLAPCHTSRVVKAFYEEKHVNVLSWPGNSPDLSPIENLWAIVKERLRKKSISSKSELINAFLSIWGRSDELQPICQNLYNSMPDRISSCIKARGGPIKY